MKQTKINYYYIRTFGCQMNYSDSERISSILESINYKPTEDIEMADLIILNSCSVRQKAEDRVVGMGAKIEKLRINKPDLKVILTGCMVKRSWDIKTASESKLKLESKLKKLMPWLNFVLEINDINEIPRLLGSSEENLEQEYLSYKPIYSSSFMAFVPISTGCDMHCTFCIVPFSRGKERDRDVQSIYLEVKDLVDRGYKDITLLGQTVNSWKSGDKPYQDSKTALYKDKLINIKGLENSKSKRVTITDDFSAINDFSDLLTLLDSIDGDWQFNFISSHPNFFDDKLIKTLGNLKHLKPYIHFAVQSGSNKVLSKMNRKYKIEDYKQIVKELRKAIPAVAITTDIIVGFPDENREDFEETKKLMQEIEYDMAYLNEYSQRSGTPAADYLKDNVTNKIKAERKDELNDVLTITALKQNQKFLNNNIKALVYDRKKGLLLAKTGHMKDVKIINTDKLEDPEKCIGEFIEVKITKVTSWGMEGVFS